MPELMPTLFFGHGNPMNALLTNTYTEAWKDIGRKLPRPKAILAVSAHWYIPQIAVTSNLVPPTIHDFGGFPRELHEVEYPAPGSPELARHVQELLAPAKVELDARWGLDHGTWSVLCHVFPQADIPVVQLSINSTQAPQFHYELGKKLAPLREHGILLAGFGNIVHNLHAYTWGQDDAAPYDWAMRFEQQVREHIVQNTDAALVDYPKLGSDALLSVPTPEHYLPLLYVLGARQTRDQVSFPVVGITGGSISMLSVQLADAPGNNL